MNSPHDPFDYGHLPGWIEKTIDIPAETIKTPRWQAIACGAGACFGMVFVAQVLLAIASHDLKEYRARSIDTASGASGIAALVTGYLVWRKIDD